MSVPSPGSRRPLLVALGFVGVLAASGLTGLGQEPARPRSTVGNPGPTRTLFTPEACAQCHDAGVSRSRSPSTFGPKEAPRLVRLDEFATWNEQDKHRRAFDALAGPRGREIGLALGFPDVTRERACLSCHGTGFLPDDPPAEVSGALDARAQGVGCTACHGPYLEWVQSHGLAGEPVRRWRRLSAVEKSRDHGMTDLRDPATRAKVCFSCHLGDPIEGKVVSHAMYAAGHPPLPGIEVASFARAMPPHWWEPHEIPLLREDAALRARYRVDPSEPAGTKAVVIGGVVALRESIRLIAAEAEGAIPAGKKAAAWPEYARFECYACHHDLKSPGYRRWRQVRGYGLPFDGMVLRGKAGHPRFRPWPLALIEPALIQAGGSVASRAARDAIRDGVSALHAAVDGRPFGDPEEVARAARRLESASGMLLDALNSSTFDASSPPRLIAALASVPENEFPDYDSARQVAWAIQSIHADWRPRPSNDDRIIAVLGELDRLLKLDPHASRESRSRLVAEKGPAGDHLGEELLRLSEREYRASLSSAADYDPVAFKKVMARLSDLLPETQIPPIPR